MPTLDIQDVTRTFSGATRQTVLRGVSMSIEQGEFVAIEGPSGGGKSTLLNIIGSLDMPTTGAYFIGRTDVQRLSDKAMSKLRSETFAFVFQSFHLLDRRAAVDSVELGLAYRGVKPKERRRRALEAMDVLGIRHLAQTRSNKLSGGERQRVALARALACEAPVIVADEPTGSLDSVNAAAVVDALQRFNRRGTTVVLVTHSAEVAAAARTRIRMSDGHTTEITTSDKSKSAVENAVEMPGTASTLRVRDVLTDATANITSRIGKTSGLVAAVALAVGLTVGSLGISGSASAQVSDRFDSHSNRDVTVEWKPGLLDDQSANMQRSASRRLGELRGVTSAAIVSSHGQTDVQAGPGRPSYQVNAFTGTAEGVAAARLSTRWASGIRHSVSKGQALIGATLAQQLNLSPIDLSPVVLINRQPFRVVGLVDQSPRLDELAGGVYLSSDDDSLLQLPNRIRALVVTRAGAAQQVAKQAPLVINPFNPNSLKVSAPSDPRTLRAEIEGTVSSTLLGLTALALIAAIAGLANAMILAVVERRQEFGLRRAIGAQRKHVFALVISESSYIGLLGGVFGLVLGLGGILTVTIAQHWIPVFDMRLAPIALVGGIAVGAASGAAAAFKAARIQPSEALRL